jgi:hypothetical protein
MANDPEVMNSVSVVIFHRPVPINTLGSGATRTAMARTIAPSLLMSHDVKFLVVMTRCRRIRREDVPSEGTG